VFYLIFYLIFFYLIFWPSNKTLNTQEFPVSVLSVLFETIKIKKIQIWKKYK